MGFRGGVSLPFTDVKAKPPKEAPFTPCLEHDVRAGVIAVISQTCGIKHEIKDGNRKEKMFVSFMATWSHCATSGLPMCGQFMWEAAPISLSHCYTVFCYVQQKGFLNDTQSNIALNQRFILKEEMGSI